MPDNSNGIFTRDYSWADDASNGIPIEPERMDADADDMADAISARICTNGNSTITADIPFNGHKITGLGPGINPTDAAQFGQISALSVTNVAAIRAFTTVSYILPFASTLGYYTSGDGGSAEYWLNTLDRTSADNGGSILVDGSGRRWYLLISGDSLNVAQFGIDITGTNDSTASLANAVAYATFNKKTLVFPAGTIKYGTSPNFAVTGARYLALGTVILNYTGTGNCLIFDGGTSGAGVNNVKFEGNFIVQGSSTAQNGVYARSFHRSTVEALVTGCGPTYSAFLGLFLVTTTIRLNSSANIYPFISGAKPLQGVKLDSLNGGGSGGLSSDCIIEKPIIEAVGGNGIVLDGATRTLILGGTSEGNSGAGIYITPNASGNIWIGCDIEANTGHGIEIQGSNNTFIGGVCSNPVYIDAGCTDNSFTNGFLCDVISNSGTNSNFDGIRYSGNGGVFSDIGINTRKNHVVNATSVTFDEDIDAGDIINYSPSVPNNVATQVLTLSKSGTFDVIVQGVNLNSLAYNCSARVAVDNGFVNVQSGPFNSANMTMTISGTAVNITQTSGATITSLTCKAKRIA